MVNRLFPSAEESADRGEFLSQKSSAPVKTYSETELEKASARGVDLSLFAFNEMLLITKLKQIFMCFNYMYGRQKA